jgi:HPr kinase/phosphorylase
MSQIFTVRELHAQLGAELALTWDGEGGERNIQQAPSATPRQPLVGPFNMIRPNRIQIVGPPEQKHLQGLDQSEYRHCLQSLFATRPAAIIFTDNLQPLPECRANAAQSGTPLLYTPQPDYHVLKQLQAYFSRLPEENATVHGVFMEVLGKGVLLSGDPSIGKSELALELISRGHRLVADDAAEFTRVNSNTLSGHCPPVLQDFLEVRGLGLINVRAMFGNTAIKPSKFLHLIIDLERLDETDMNQIDRLSGCCSCGTILGIEVPRTLLPVAPGRNLSILVETAVRQHMLKSDGYDAAEDFIQRQREFIDNPRN